MSNIGSRRKVLHEVRQSLPVGSRGAQFLRSLLEHGAPAPRFKVSAAFGAAILTVLESSTLDADEKKEKIRDLLKTLDTPVEESRRIPSDQAARAKWLSAADVGEPTAGRASLAESARGGVQLARAEAACGRVPGDRAQRVAWLGTR